MRQREPFHAGEIAVQERSGEREQGARNGAILHEFVTLPACRFLARQRVLAVALPDGEGRPWASVWMGEPGFVGCEDPRTVRLVTRPPPWAEQDPSAAMVVPGGRLGLLSIDLGTRQRLRINGSIASVSPEGISLAVEESFANCPKYIQQRELGSVAAATTGGAGVPLPLRGSMLGDTQRDLIQRADTLFIASHHPERGLDASHRGGTPGFVRAVDGQTLRFPDYPGNSMFQTLGNLELDPRAGLAVLDFEQARVLCLRGSSRTIHGEDDPTHPSGGTGRYFELDIAEWVELPFARQFEARLIERSPFNPPPSVVR